MEPSNYSGYHPQWQCLVITEPEMRPCCSDTASAFCIFTGGVFFVFFLLSLLLLFYSCYSQRKIFSMLFEVSVVLWLLTRALSLTFMNNAPQGESTESRFCLYLALQSFPLFFYS